MLINPVVGKSPQHSISWLTLHGLTSPARQAHPTGADMKDAAPEQVKHIMCMSMPTGKGPLAFCSGGDQAVRGEGGYVGEDSVPRLNVLDLQACA